MRKSTIIKLTLESIRYIVALYGLWQILKILSPFISFLLRYLIISGLLVSIIFPLIYWFTRPPLLREYNLESLQKEFLVTNQRIEVNIQNTGTRTATIREYVYIKQPEERELYDLLYVIGEATPQTVNYESPDSIQVGFKIENRNKLKVFWKPKGEILPSLPSYILLDTTSKIG